MVIVMKSTATKEDIKQIERLLERLDLGAHISTGMERTIIGVIGDKRLLEGVPLELMSGVDKLVPIVEPYKLASRTFQPESSIIRIGNSSIGGEKLAVIAGPCAVEGEEQIIEIAKYLKSMGVEFIRGGAYKPRTSPYSFQGLEEEGFKLLAQAREETGLLVVSEVISTEFLDQAAKYIDVIQIGARNMQNFQLLREVGRLKKPVVLKRGLASTIEEWLNAAEYIMKEGNYNIILCERGIRTFETYTRNTLDLSSVPVVKELSHLPIIVDPSHGTGRSSLVRPMSRAAIGAGADGLMIEMHPNPKLALSDGPQSLDFKEFGLLMEDIKRISQVVGREM
ncbi:MAG: bifunctional 3-deoxy-7-phosphoheptulonate synthase/chorismate mutase [Xylanivirga thermophila]|jgi:3-deoxy-7-phosphoheptulonate synthase|uniref:3-deoxy-7-phosphoheptulonate synthase n=1 Tax=Xylanivirga thermophila TaxID=2496273 RepID=UPI00101D03F8|nr:3-deoxy-7-phosphoheptulonate synthase [Xylanivirga thermophila]